MKFKEYKDWKVSLREVKLRIYMQRHISNVCVISIIPKLFQIIYLDHRAVKYKIWKIDVVFNMHFSLICIFVSEILKTIFVKKSPLNLCFVNSQ